MCRWSPNVVLMQERQQEEADRSKQPSIVSGDIECSNSINDEPVSGNPGLVSIYVCFLDYARTNRQ
jgi:hypothetical protein